MSYNMSYYNNIDKIEQVEGFRDVAIGDLSSRQLKIKLNKLSKFFPYIYILRNLMETEDANINAKRYSFDRRYKEQYYAIKTGCLNIIINYLNANIDTNKYLSQLKYGKGDDVNCYVTSNVIYFDLIETKKQISFHYTHYLKVPEYKEDWDGVPNVTLERILEEIEVYLKKIKININDDLDLVLKNYFLELLKKRDLDNIDLENEKQIKCFLDGFDTKKDIKWILKLYNSGKIKIEDIEKNKKYNIN
jgi:hypothetical protein